VAAGATLGGLIDRLAAEIPRIAAARGRIRFVVNQEYATDSTVLADGDEVAVIPPVSGGAMPAARLVREPIDVAALMREVENPRVGGIALFVGTVRYETDGGRGLRALEYTAYDQMALAEMGRLCEQAVADTPVHKIVMAHRLGVLRIGEVSVAVVAAAAHRGDAFDVCRTLIDRFKQRVPIFKKELWQDGASTWVDGI
jgi:molybdopterin synthase catalytic subunit